MAFAWMSCRVARFGRELERCERGILWLWARDACRDNVAMHVVLVRHGQSENNVIEQAHGESDAFFSKRSIDPPLSALGR
eukprot:5345434-Prymnesium_polylepis.1